MALKEYYIGTTGPLYIDDIDPLYSDPQQMAVKNDLSGSTGGATSVVSETTFGQSPIVGTSTAYARQDHSHGTPDNPVAGFTGTQAVVTSTGPPVVTVTMHYTNGLLTSIT